MPNKEELQPSDFGMFTPTDAIYIEANWNKLTQMPNNHTYIFLKMEEYQHKRKTFKLLTDFLNKGGKLFSQYKYAQGRQCLFHKYLFWWEIIEKAVKSCPSVERTYELIMAMQRKIFTLFGGYISALYLTIAKGGLVRKKQQSWKMLEQVNPWIWFLAVRIISCQHEMPWAPRLS